MHICTFVWVWTCTSSAVQYIFSPTSYSINQSIYWSMTSFPQYRPTIALMQSAALIPFYVDLGSHHARFPSPFCDSLGDCVSQIHLLWHTRMRLPFILKTCTNEVIQGSKLTVIKEFSRGCVNSYLTVVEFVCCPSCRSHAQRKHS